MAKYRIGYDVGGSNGRREMLADTSDLVVRYLLLDLRAALVRADDAMYVGINGQWVEITDILPSGRIIDANTILSTG